MAACAAPGRRQASLPRPTRRCKPARQTRRWRCSIRFPAGSAGRGLQPQMPRGVHAGALGSAANDCEQAVKAGRAELRQSHVAGPRLGREGSRASFLSAFSLAKRVRAEFEEAVRLNPRNAEALADLGEFYYSAPGSGGRRAGQGRRSGRATGQDRPGARHELRGQIAEQRKDYGTAEREFKQAIASRRIRRFQWMTLAASIAAGSAGRRWSRRAQRCRAR
jgi:tetratricopeptide (TPR) repeat protein